MHYLRFLDDLARLPAEEVPFDAAPTQPGVYGHVEQDETITYANGAAQHLLRYGFTLAVPSTTKRALLFLATDVDASDPVEGYFPQVTLLCDLRFGPAAYPDLWVIPPTELRPYGAWQHDVEDEGDLALFLFLFHEEEEYAVRETTRLLALMHDEEVEPFHALAELFYLLEADPQVELILQHITVYDEAFDADGDPILEEDEWEPAY